MKKLQDTTHTLIFSFSLADSLSISFTVCLFLGIHNYKRAGIFYVIPTEVKYGMYRYFAKAEVLVESKKSSIIEVNKSEVKKVDGKQKNLMKNNDLVYLSYTGYIKESGDVFDTTIEKEAKDKGIFRSNQVYEPILVAIGDGWVVKGIAIKKQ